MFKNLKKKHFMSGVDSILTREDLEKATPKQLYAISSVAFRFADADPANAHMLRQIGVVAHRLAYMRGCEALGK